MTTKIWQNGDTGLYEVIDDKDRVIATCNTREEAENY